MLNITLLDPLDATPAPDTRSPERIVADELRDAAYRASLGEEFQRVWRDANHVERQP